MKPYEETWAVGACGNPIHTANSLCHSLRDGNGDSLKLTPERLKLAAKAPVMARLLLAARQPVMEGHMLPLWTLQAIDEILREAGVIP